MTTQSIKRIGIGVLVVLILAVVFTCNGKDTKDKLIQYLGGFTQQNIKVTIDTVSIEYDSIFYENQQLKIAISNLVKPDTITKWKTKWLVPKKDSDGNVIGTTEIDTIFDKVYSYSQPFSDTLIDGKILAKVDVKTAKIVDLGLEYTPKMPKLVTKTITVEKIIEKTIANPPKDKFGIGAIGQTTGIGGTLVYQTKKNWQFQAGYLKNIDKSIPVDGIVQVGIIKLF